MTKDGYIKLKDILIDKRYVLEKENKFHGYRIPTPDEAKAQSRKHTNFYDLGEEVFQKVNDEKDLSTAQLEQVLSSDDESINYILEYLSFDLLYDKNGVKKLEKELNDYIELYLQGEVVANDSHRYLSYQNQQIAFERTIGRLAKVYGAKNLILNDGEIWAEIAKPSSDSHRNYLSQTRFLETLLAMEHKNLIEIVDVIRENEVRVTITADETPSLNVWNRDFYNIADSSSYFEFIKNKVEASRKGISHRNVTVNNEITWNGITLNTKTGWANNDGMRHRFKPSKPHYKVLKALIEADGEPVTYEKFFKVVDAELAKNPKIGKEFIRQKIRDIRKYFGINRQKSWEKDVFSDTGDGFQLLKLSNPSGITK